MLLQRVRIEMTILSKDYAVIESAIRYIDLHYQNQPTLDEIAGHVHLSKYHFQRLFTRWAGISPKKFLQYLTVGHAKRLLQESWSVLDASFELGLSSPSRLHDLFVTFEALSPGEYKQRGKNLEIVYGFHDSPFGQSLIAKTERGICWLSFVIDGGRQRAVREMQVQWEGAVFSENDVGELAAQVFAPYETGEKQAMGLHIRGTNFQIKVWEALLKIPPGSLVSYRYIAERIHMPAAARAVGSAVGKNPVSVVIPCHRVIRESGALGHYRWGEARKRLIVGLESVKRDAAAHAILA
jgi:AraC family transcriptional regulator of adaptative response/methylated-DNA-[protein]-cysteine methyltransferase